MSWRLSSLLTPRRLLDGWPRHRSRVLRLAVFLMVCIAGIWLGYEFWRLLFQKTPAGNVALEGPVGAVDLSLRHLEVNGWFAGERIYRTQGNAVYPPASYLLLWPLVGWLSFTASRWLFALITLGAVALLVRLYVRAGGELSREERWLLALIPLATYPVGATIGNGQIGILVLLCVVVSLPLLKRCQASWARDVCVAALFLLALVKPNMAAPFFWIVLFAPGGRRPAVLIGAGYAGLTTLASLAQRRGPLQLMMDWQARAVHGSAWGADQGEGSIRTVSTGAGEDILRITSINLHSVMGHLGHVHQITIASIVVLALVGIWVWFRRKSSVWLVMGVVALVARFYTYHGWYDDIVLLLPLIALFRVAKDRATFTPSTKVAAGVLFAAMLTSMLAPGGTYLFRHPWNNLYLFTQSALWLCVLIFLAHLARRPDSDHGCPA